MKKKIFLVARFILLMCLSSQVFASVDNRTFTTGTLDTSLYGVHEVGVLSNSTLVFTFSNGTQKRVVHGFYDGNGYTRARLYCDVLGTWTWTTNAGDTGSFRVVPSTLKGKLKASGQYILRDNNESFIPIVDTGYNLLSTSKTPMHTFVDYINQAEQHGITMLRVIAAGMGVDDDVNKLAFYYADQSHNEFAYMHFNTDDQRIQWALQYHPDMQFQLILYIGVSDGYNGEDSALHALGEEKRKKLLQYMIDRYAAYPNINFLVYNDAAYENHPINTTIAKEALLYLKENDPFHTLRSTGHQRNKEYHMDLFGNGLSTYLHFETEDDLDAHTLDKYVHYNVPLFSGEDWYEFWYGIGDTTTPKPNADYFYRRGGWSWVLSGGGFAYGGKYEVSIPYATLQDRYGVKGMDDLHYVTRFFKDFNLSLRAFTFNDAYANNGENNRDRAQAMKSQDTYVVYTPVAKDITLLALDLDEKYQYIWMNPDTGAYTSIQNVEDTHFSFPDDFDKDAVLLVSKKNDFHLPQGMTVAAPKYIYPLTNITSTSADLKFWDYANNEEGFKVYDTNSKTWIASHLEAHEGTGYTHFSLTDLQPCTNYTIYVRAYNHTSESQNSESQTFKTACEEIQPAVMSTPLEGATLQKRQTFTWHKNNATLVHFYLYDRDNGNELLYAAPILGSQVTLEIPDNGHHLFVDLYSFKGEDKINNGIRTTYIAPSSTNTSAHGPAVLTSPKAWSKLSTKQTFTWEKRDAAYVRFYIRDDTTGRLIKAVHTPASSITVDIPKNGHRIYMTLASYRGPGIGLFKKITYYFKAK
ncbi:MAG: hypothetical protein DSZ08_07290 [Sulfurovum sp.]|nr:MAG: hypothetical protein DSZ08_07290 [Sulfurovum sp.]